MGWPIPKQAKPQAPKRMDWKMWMLALLACLGVGSAAVVFFWPTGRTTHTQMFWALVAGLPMSVFAIMFGVKYNIWEQQQLEYEEQLHENARLMALWHEWANRDVVAVAAASWLGGIESTEQWEQRDYELPVNLGRGRKLKRREESPETLEQRQDGSHDEVQDKRKRRCEEVISLVIERFSVQLKNIESLQVVVVLDENGAKTGANGEAEAGAGGEVKTDADADTDTQAEKETTSEWTEAVEKAFAGLVAKLAVEIHPATTMSAWLARWVDQDALPFTLVIAGQLHGDEETDAEDAAGYSEGIAALLLDASNPATRKRQAKFPAGCRLLRPMTCIVGRMAEDIRQMADIQVGNDTIDVIWCCALDKDTDSKLHVALGQDLTTKQAVVRNVDGALGLPGPLSAWMALALGVEMALRSARTQLVTARDAGEPLVLCTLLPVNVKGEAS